MVALSRSMVNLVHDLYLIEQGVLAAVAAPLLFLFAIQNAYAWLTIEVGALKKWFQRLGLLSSALICLRLIDPHGFHGFLDRGYLFQWLADNTTCLLFTAGSILPLRSLVPGCVTKPLAAACSIYFQLESLSRLVDMGPLLKLVGHLCKILTALTFLVANVGVRPLALRSSPSRCCRLSVRAAGSGRGARPGLLPGPLPPLAQRGLAASRHNLQLGHLHPHPQCARALAFSW